MGNKVTPDLLGTEVVHETHATHTHIFAVELFEGTDEVRFVRKQLLSQDFEGRALGPPNTADERTDNEQKIVLTI